jgi:hypothetical protein
LGLEREQASESNQQPECDSVKDGGLEESLPRETALHEYVRPERSRGRAKFERREAAREDNLAQVTEEDPRPGRQLD